MQRSALSRSGERNINSLSVSGRAPWPRAQAFQVHRMRLIRILLQIFAVCLALHLLARSLKVFTSFDHCIHPLYKIHSMQLQIYVVVR